LSARDLPKDPFGTALRFAAGSVYDLDSVRQGFQAWFRSGGAISLERCLGLPTTPGQLRRARRDSWLRVASQCLFSDGSAYERATELAHELDVFLSRGGWAQWQALATPPPTASALRQALWQVATLNDGKSLSAKHVHRILRGVGTDLPEEMSEGFVED
jgi:hypothetical protein